MHEALVLCRFTVAGEMISSQFASVCELDFRIGSIFLQTGQLGERKKISELLPFAAPRLGPDVS